MTQTTQKTNVDGSTTFQKELTVPGKYTAKATFAGNSVYEASESTTHTFKVPNEASSSLITPSLSISNSDNNSIYWNTQTSFSATVTANNSAVTGITVYFVYINANGAVVSMGNAITNSNGVATINFTSTDTTDGSTWTIYAYTEADSTYAAARSANIIVTNHRIPTTISLTVSPSSHTDSGSSTLTATLKNALNNEPIGSKQVTFKKGSRTLGFITTNSSGVATRGTETLTTTSSFTAVYTQSSSDGYAGCTSNSVTVTISSSTITVLNTTLTMNSINTNIAVGGTLSCTGTLIDSSGAVVTGRTVKMNITSPSDSSVNINVTGTTDYNGQVTLTRSVTGAGTWNVKLVFDGVANVYNSSESSSRTVTTYDAKATSITGLADNGSALVRDDVLDPVLRDYSGAGISGKSISITLSNGSNSVTYTGSTLSSGKVYGLNGTSTGLKLQLSGTFSLGVSVSFAGDSSYNSANLTRTYTYSG